MSRRTIPQSSGSTPARPSGDHTSLDGIVPDVVKQWPCNNQRTSLDFRSSAAFATVWGLSSTAGKMLPPPRSSNAGIVVRHVARWAIYACSLVQGRRACSKFEAPTMLSLFQTVSGNLGTIHGHRPRFLICQTLSAQPLLLADGFHKLARIKEYNGSKTSCAPCLGFSGLYCVCHFITHRSSPCRQQQSRLRAARGVCDRRYIVRLGLPRTSIHGAGHRGRCCDRS